MNKLSRLLDTGLDVLKIWMHREGRSRFANFLRYKLTRLLPVVPCANYTPQIARFLVTNRCNLRCSYCGLSQHVEYDDPSALTELTLERLQTALQTPLLKNTILVDLTGGEPLLVSEFEEMVRYIHSSGRLVFMSTNGLLLPPRIAGLKKAGINRINLSIHPGNRSFLEKHLSEINSVYPVHASYVLRKSALEKDTAPLEQTIEFARSAGCRKLHFWMYFPQGRNVDFDEVIPNNDFPSYQSFRKNATRKFKDFIVWPGGISAGTRPRRCRQLWQDIMIDSSGGIAPCCGTNGSLPPGEANLFSTSADLIYNHPRLVDLRIKFLDQSTACPPECKSCFLLEHPGW